MDLIFEFCFYVGILVTAAGIIWLLRSTLTTSNRRVIAPLAMICLGVMLILGPGIVSRSLVVDLGPRETIVNNERHITLTGWDGETYSFLAQKSDAVVLQMANADVSDETLDLLAKMSQLRELDLNDSSVTDAGLAKLSSLPSLQTLRLRGTKITDAGFRQHLLNLPGLMQLDLRQTSVSDEAVAEWQQSNSQRRVLR